MSVEWLARGQRCNLTCENYCYESQLRAAGNTGDDGIDLEASKQALLDSGVGKPDGRGGITGWTLFGGEPLLTKISDIEEMLRWSQSIGAPVGCQTNGSLMVEDHFRLWKQYGVGVGISMDGPGELGDERTSPGGLEATRKTTARSQAALERCLAEGVSTSLIVTLHRTNASTDEKLDRLIAWLHDLNTRGLRSVNFHTLEPGHGDDSIAMSQDRQIGVMRRLYHETKCFAHVSPFADMRKKLLSENGANCIWNSCSPQSTPSVTAVDGRGTKARCGRLNTDGVPWERSSIHSFERYLGLWLTPVAQGGCGGCIHFLACGGGNCPGEGEGGDWRRKTTHCRTIYTLLDDISADLFAEGREPVSYSLRRPALEAQLLARWTGNTMPSGDTTGNRPHLDHTDAERPIITDASGRRIQ